MREATGAEGGKGESQHEAPWLTNRHLKSSPLKVLDDSTPTPFLLFFYPLIHTSAAPSVLLTHLFGAR